MTHSTETAVINKYYSKEKMSRERWSAGVCARKERGNEGKRRRWDVWVDVESLSLVLHSQSSLFSSPFIHPLHSAITHPPPVFLRQLQQQSNQYGKSRMTVFFLLFTLFKIHVLTLSLCLALLCLCALYVSTYLLNSLSVVKRRPSGPSAKTPMSLPCLTKSKS